MSIPFQISTELFGHEGAVRVAAAIEVTKKDTPAAKTLKIVTGAMDSVVKCWKVNEDGSYVESLNIYDHEHWITALITIPTSVVNTTTTTTSSSTNISGFITGCMDKKIRMYSEDGILVSILTGHEGGIISFGFTSDGHLISGSWDGTARIWDLKKALCIGVLSGHENGVCVLGLPNGTIVTGSTGKQVGNTVVDFQLRFWNQDFSLQKTLKDHTGPIRELSIVPEIGFCSCSNDGSIKIRTFDGQVVATMAHPLNAEGKPGFVLGVCTIVRQSMDSLIVSASEDCTARVWNLQGDLLQTIEHPSGLWGVTCLPNGDFITCCEDKVARVFTASIERQGSPQVIANFTAAIEEAKIVRQRGPKDVDIDQLPEYERRFEILGKTDGQIQMFKTNNNKAWACQWSQPSKTWIDIGEVTGTGNGGVVDGEAFDLVIPVEIEMPGGNGGQVRKLEIGYNQGQNPFQVAQAFIDKHFLDQNYLNQIADYISQRSSHYSPPLLQDASLASTTGTTTTKTTIKSQMFDLFPSKAYNTFESIKITKLLSTVLQLNTNEKQQQQATQKDIESLTQIVQTVQETAFYHASTFSKQDISILIALIRRWKPENIYPLLDLARLVLIHPQGANVLASTLFIERVIELGTSSQQTSTTTTTTTTTTTMTRMLTLRVLANLFFQPQARECLVQNKTLVISSLASYLKLAKDNKLVSLSLSTVLFNFAHLAHSNKNSLTLEEAKEIVHVSIELLTAISQQEQDSSSIGGIGGGGGSGGIGGMGGGGGYDENTILRSLICLGTLSLTFPTTLKSLIQEKLLPVSARMKASVICSLNKDNTPSMLTICWKELEEILEIH